MLKISCKTWDRMATNKLSAIEKFVLVLVILVLATGYIIFYSNRSLFVRYVQEDGIVEWLTVAGLLGGSFVCLSRFTKLFSTRNNWFLFVTLALALFLFFAAGEEISWGQRIFGIKTPAYFQSYNTQQETNIHNLVVDGVKVNKLVFSIMLIGMLAIFLTIVPILYHKNDAFKKLSAVSGLPIPQLYQVIGFIIVFILAELIPDGKNAELLECDGALLFFLIISYPKNKQIFDADNNI